MSTPRLVNVMLSLFIGNYYEVAVIASQTPPYYIGQSVTFNCAITPQPLFPVSYYQWKFSSSSVFLYFGGENFTITIHSDYYESDEVYCEVAFSDLELVGVFDFTVKGKNYITIDTQ